MPELPETETIARDLDREISGDRITEVRVKKSDVLRETTPTRLRRRLVGASITRAWRRAKLVILDLSSGDRLVVQPRFTGALLIDSPAHPLDQRERQYSTLAIELESGRTLHYRDIRRLGTVALMTNERFSAYSLTLGVEPLGRSFTVSRLAELLGSSDQPIKKRLMDQRLIAGVGNIYANESLWRASIDPSRPARSLSRDDIATLHRAIRDVLEESIAHRGTSFRDYRDASGARGSFAERLAVYGRGGLPCPRCGSRLIDTNAIDGRTTVLCAHCQN